MTVTGNGDFSQVFLVPHTGWASQAKACPIPSSLGTRAVVPAYLTALAGSFSHPTHLFIIFLCGLVL